ncbi:MAG TPA: hypothetical protein VMJ35_11675 [Dongiaceae bacterium]|nr:hypothetical protein [Dongiaceae bacterium]
MFKGPVVMCLLLSTSVVVASCSKRNKTENTPEADAGSKPAPSPNETGKTSGESTAKAAEAASGKPVKAEMRNVLFRLTDRAGAKLENVSGELWPVGKSDLVVFDDKASFEMRIANGTVSIRPEALADVMNNYVFARSDAPLKDISIAIKKDQLIVKGKLHSKGDVPFETGGTLSADPDGRLRMNTEKVKAMHVPVKGVMGLFGIDLAKVINTSKVAGMDTDKNDLLMDLGELLPPPHIRGRVKSVQLTNDAIITTFGDGGKTSGDGKEIGNYMRFEGNRVQFGKLTMENTDLTLIDLDPRDPLDWDQGHYKEQVVEGYSKITSTFGLQTYVKDYAKLKRLSQTRGAAIPEN